MQSRACSLRASRATRTWRRQRATRPVHRIAVARRSDALVDAGPKTEKPDYLPFERSPLNQILMRIFRNSLTEAIGGEDSPLEGYSLPLSHDRASAEHRFDGIIDLARRLNDSRRNTPAETRQKATQVLRSLFPAWFTSAVRSCISHPFPEVSARLNAWTTSVTCTWLMGAMEVNDIELEDGEMGQGQGVFVERCRFLEESGCASICHNSCKLPTQKFFKEEMGIDVTLDPDYEDFSCQFTFGKKPLAESEDPVLQTPCFLQCPTKKRFTPSCSDLIQNSS